MRWILGSNEFDHIIPVLIVLCFAWLFTTNYVSAVLWYTFILYNLWLSFVLALSLALFYSIVRSPD